MAKGTQSRKLRKVIWEGPYVILWVGKCNAMLKHIKTHQCYGPVHLNRLKAGYTECGQYTMVNGNVNSQGEQNGTQGEDRGSSINVPVQGTDDADSQDELSDAQNEDKGSSSDIPVQSTDDDRSNNVVPRQGQGSGTKDMRVTKKGSVLPGGYYMIKKIIDSFYDRKQKKYFYKIWWDGKPKSQSTFELEEAVPIETRRAYHEA